MVVLVPGARAAVLPSLVGPKTITVDGDPSDWSGTVPADNTGAVSNQEFVWNDTAGDDTGDGDYTYPKAGDLNRTGLFDIREVRITANISNLYVLIKVANLSNAWGGSDGFSTVAAVLLIDTTRDTAGQLTARPNVNITAGKGWEYFVKIGQTGWQAENAKVFDTSGHWAPIVNRANSAFNSIEVSVPLAFIGKDGYDINLATWGFMFFLQSHAGENPNGFRDVVAARWSQDWVFGGGADHNNDPQIEDIAFSSTKVAQEAELANYTVDYPTTMESSANVSFDNVGFAPDTTPPQILNPSATPTFNQADIGWTTDELANTTVWYGTNPTPTSRRAVDEFVTSHLVTLSGLDPQTTYYYQIESWDIAGNMNTTAVGSFTTLILPPANIASWVGNTFVWEDTRGDDTGDGNYVYPNEPTVRWQGRGDIWFLNMTLEGNWIHYTVKINAKAETEWRQRMAGFVMFIDQDHIAGSGAQSVKFVQPESDPGHPLNISVAPEFAWEWMVLATFQNYSEFTLGDYRGEMILRDSAFDPGTNTYHLDYISTSRSASLYPDAGMVQSTVGGTQLDFWLNRTVVGTSLNWTYVALGALYDDAGAGWPSGGIRQVRPSAATWEGGGSNGLMNPNVYDLAFYPTTANQQTDLSQYVSTGYTSVTNAMQVDLSTLWNEMLSVQNVLGISTSSSVSQVNAGESAGIAGFVTNRNSPIAGATVTLSASPASAVDIISPNPTTTNAFGAALFTVRGRSVAADTTVTLTMTAQVGSATVTSQMNLLVLAPVITHSYGLFASAADGVLATGGQTTVTAVFTDKGAPVSGASVSLQSNNAVLTVVTASQTTNAQGQAVFTVRAGYTETAVAATLAGTGTNGTSTATGTLSVTVSAYVHSYSLGGSASPTIVAGSATTTLTFQARDVAQPLAAATVAISLSPTTGFDVVGDISKTTDTSGQVTFTLRARSVSSDTAVVVTATLTNGTATATATVIAVAQAPPPTAPPTPQAGIAVEVFGGVTALLAILAVAFAALWMKARGGRPPEKKEEEGPGDV
ncbi:MAG: glucodextranase DOMON-like domain-containing protein [Thermoplasmata archaeon]